MVDALSISKISEIPFVFDVTNVLHVELEFRDMSELLYEENLVSLLKWRSETRTLRFAFESKMVKSNRDFRCKPNSIY